MNKREIIAKLAAYFVNNHIGRLQAAKSYGITGSEYGQIMSQATGRLTTKRLEAWCKLFGIDYDA